MTLTMGKEERLRSCHDCLDVTRTVYSRCDPCRKKRRAKDRKYRRNVARAAFPPDLRERILALLRRGRKLSEVAQVLRVDMPQIHGFARGNPKFRADLDRALMAGRDPKLKHGSADTYRRHGCRCPECRAAKRKSGAWER